MDLQIFNQPIKVGGITFKNRFLMAPMTFAAFNDPEGYSKAAVEYYRRRARGGIGTIVTGAVGTDGKVDPYAALGPVPLNHPEEWVRRAKKLTAAVHEEGGKIICQLSLGLGRNYPGLPAPSVLPVFASDAMSPELTKEQIVLKIQQLVDTSVLAKEAGFDGVEIHAMHWGYLLDQFGTSFFNHRTDEYGGSLDNRLRAAREIVEGIHKVCGPEYPVGMRLSLKTFVKDFDKATLTGEEEAGRTLEEGVEIAKRLEAYGYDFLDVDTGTYDSFYYACPPMYMPQGFMIPYAKAAKAAVKIPVFAGGRMQNVELAYEAVKKGEIDGVTLGRATLADPEIVNKILAGDLEDIRPCIGCNLGCFHRGITLMKPGSCAVNPEAARETLKKVLPGVGQKKVAVIGGGAGGMETAYICALRGYEVTIYEKSDHLGGHLIEAGAHSFKSEVRKLNAWYQKKLKELHVNVEYHTEITPEFLEGLTCDAIVLATGSVPSCPKIPGLEKAVISLDAIHHPEQLGRKVIVVGGGLVGCELALDEAKKGKDVTIVEALDQLMGASGEGSPLPNTQMMLDLFAYHQVQILTNTKLVEVTDTGVKVEDAEGIKEIAADSVVSAIGFRPGNSLLGTFKTNAEVYEIGDAKAAKTILNAVWEGFDTANEI